MKSDVWAIVIAEFISWAIMVCVGHFVCWVVGREFNYIVSTAVWIIVRLLLSHTSDK